MIIALIVLIAFIAGIICIFIDNKISRYFLSCVGITGVLLSVLGFFGILMVSTTAINANINKDIDYQNMLYKREMLEYRIDHIDKNVVGNEMIYNDIIEFNNQIRRTKKWANNPWTNWFYNDDIATIDYIELNSD